MDRLRRKLDPPCPLVSRGHTEQAGWGLCLEGTRRTGFVLYARRVAAAVHQVRYDPADGPPVTLRLGPKAEGTRWFSLAVRAADRPGRIRAYDSGGERLASTRIP